MQKIKCKVNKLNLIEKILKLGQKIKKLENTKFGPGILWDRPSMVASSVGGISPYYRGRNGSLMSIG